MQAAQPAGAILPTGPIVVQPPQEQGGAGKPIKISFSNPDVPHLTRYIKSSSARGLPLATKDMHADARGALICGLGPSMQKPSVLNEIRNYYRRGWLIVGLKEAITYLRSKGIAVDYSVNMDPGAREAQRTPIYPGVTYCLASSCNPALYDAVLAGGAKAMVFHSACGATDVSMIPGFLIELSPWQKSVCLGQHDLLTEDGDPFAPVLVEQATEIALYQKHFGCGDTICGGFTVANRALGLVKYMGVPRVVMAGVDFGWRDNSSYYAPFCNAEPLRDTWMNDHGEVDGKTWHTRPDLLASAVDVAWKIKDGTVSVLGDSLAASLAKRDDAYLKQVVKLQ